MKMKTLIWLVLVVFALPLVAFAEGKDKGSTNCAPKMASTPEAQLIIERWRLKAWQQGQTNKLYREYSLQSKVLGDEKVYTFAQAKVPGFQRGTIAGFVSILKPADLRESREDKITFGFRFDFPTR